MSRRGGRGGGGSKISFDISKVGIQRVDEVSSGGRVPPPTYPALDPERDVDVRRKAYLTTLADQLDSTTLPPLRDGHRLRDLCDRHERLLARLPIIPRSINASTTGGDVNFDTQPTPTGVTLTDDHFRHFVKLEFIPRELLPLTLTRRVTKGARRKRRASSAALDAVVDVVDDEVGAEVSQGKKRRRNDDDDDDDVAVEGDGALPASEAKAKKAPGEEGSSESELENDLDEEDDGDADANDYVHEHFDNGEGYGDDDSGEEDAGGYY